MIHPGLKGQITITGTRSLLALLCCFIAFTGAARAQYTEPGPYFNEYSSAHLAMVTDVGASTLASPASQGCYGASENVTVTITNYTGTPIDFAVDTVTVTVNVTGTATQTFTTILNSGTLAANGTMNVNAGILNMTAPGTYTFNASTSSTGDSNISNNAMPAAIRTTYGLASLPQTVSFTGFTGNNLSTVFPGWREASGVTPAGSTSSWTFQNNVGSQGNTTARINLFTTTRNEWIIGPKITAATNTTLRFKVAVTDQGTTSNPDVMGPDDKVRVMVSTNCGATWITVMTFDASNNLTPALTQYGMNLGAYSGQEIMIAFYASDGPVDDINNYDFHLDDISIDNLNGIDMGAVSLASPSTGGCLGANETITVNLRNHGFTAVNFATDNTTINVSVTGPNPQTFSATVINGTLAPGGIMPVTLTTSYDMTQPGIYVFNSYASVATSDYDASNNAMEQTYLVSTRPTVTASQDDTICSGNSTMLDATGTAFGPGPTGEISFSNTSSLAVMSQDTAYSTINVASPLYAFELHSVVIDSLYHVFNSDLDIYLIAPNGSRIELTSDNGTNSDNYIATRFIPTAPVSIISGFGPFTGDYLPEQSFSMLSGSANGTWTLEVIDDSPGDDGTLKGWTINMKTPNAIVGYSWSPAAGLSSSTIYNPVASPVTTTNYTVTVTDQNGCTHTEDVLITVNPTPAASITLTNAIMCNGDNDAAATAAATGGTGSYSYLWSDGQTTATASNLSPSTYSVTVTDIYQCADAASINITEPTALSVSTSSSNETCSPGNDGTASASVSGGTQSYSYSWSSGHTAATATHLPAGTYSVTVTDANMCTITDQVTVNGSVPPAASASNDTTICEGSAVMLTASGGTNYSWDNGAGNDDTVSVSPTNTTVYTVTVTDNNGCTAMEQVTVNVDQLAAASFTYNNTGTTVFFTNGSSNAISYSWDFGDGSPADNSSDPSYTYTMDGTYLVTLIASNGCNSDTTTDIVVVTSTGIKESEQAMLIVTPNPSQGIFSISGTALNEMSISIYDMHGKLVHVSNVAAGSFIGTIDITSFAKGVYHLRAISGNSITTKKIIIE